MGLDLGDLGKLLTALVVILIGIVGAMTYAVRSFSKTGRLIARMREELIQKDSWIYEARTTAAQNGWKLPPPKREMTLEYLKDIAKQDESESPAGVLRDTIRDVRGIDKG